MGIGSHIEQRTEKDDTIWELLGPNSMLLKRRMHILSPGTQVDVFGTGWGVTLGNALEEPIVCAKVGGQPVSILHKKIMCYYPPFSIVEWELQPGEHYFEGIFTGYPLPSDMPTRPVAFISPVDELPHDEETLLQLIREAPGKIPIHKEDEISAPARRMKEAIDKGFLEDISIGALAAEIGFNQDTTTRAFRRAYGMTPVGYRSKLRVYASVKEIVAGKLVAEAARHAGYKDMSQYIRQFKREMSTLPSKIMLPTH